MRRFLLPLAGTVMAAALFAALIPGDAALDVYDLMQRDPQIAAAQREVAAASDSLRRISSVIERTEILAHAAGLRRSAAAFELSAEPDVPVATRQAFAERLAAVGAALGTPRVPVRVHVVRVDRLFGAYTRYVVMPREGEPCIVVVAIRRNQAQLRPLDGDRVIGACGFYAAYGMPGAGMQQWLETDQGRSTGTDSASAEFFDHRPRAGRAPALLAAFSPVSVACVAGNDAACERTLFGARPMDQVEVPAPPRGATRRVLRAGTVSRPTLPTVTLALLREHLGEASFARLWASDEALAEAYPRLTGEPMAVFARAALRTEVPPRRPGPLHGGLPLLLGLAVGGALATWAIRGTKRARS
ncbi:MAG: hypothetical protein KF689_04385 [Gemmatimonadaceae bacterium]|nr:hypothetical protein [Gemmatimonadaceae bacterium]MCW5825588.1 hypothetical protein [Gemmatimonadaceae bacterium]